MVFASRGKPKPRRTRNVFKFRRLLAQESSCAKGVSGCFGTLGVEIAVKSIHRGFKHKAAVGAAFEMALDLGFNDRGQTPF